MKLNWTMISLWGQKVMLHSTHVKTTEVAMGGMRGVISKLRKNSIYSHSEWLCFFPIIVTNIQYTFLM